MKSLTSLKEAQYFRNWMPVMVIGVQCSMKNPLRYLTTFNSPFGRFRFTRLPFGLCVSQDIFQQKMDFVLEKCPGTVGIADDIAVHGTTEEEHDSNLHNLMLVAREHGLVFTLDKCTIKESKHNILWNVIQR